MLWDQCVCFVLNGDLFKVICVGCVLIVIDEIECFMLIGFQLKSGQQFDVDVIVIVIGLKVKMFGGVCVMVDGCVVDLLEMVLYKGMMYSDVLNFVLLFGYMNVLWMLKVELIVCYVCWLFNYMCVNGYDMCVLWFGVGDFGDVLVVNLSLGYIQCVVGILLKQGYCKLWKFYQNYVFDFVLLKFSVFVDFVMYFECCVMIGLVVIVLVVEFVFEIC